MLSLDSIQKEVTPIAKTDRCVVRNAAYRRGEFSIRERHNERKNESYHNGDIIPERSPLNIQFKTCAGTYEQQFSRMVEDGAISLRGLKADAKVFDELVFDVNSGYFENHGGYEYAKEFFTEAYNLAVKEAGGEEYILSAVLHADERNKALSEQLGRDVFHYHLHVVYVPVVDKEIKWTKRCKDPSLAGTVKEVIKQVSHSKKWPRFKDENGHCVNSYSLLQDRFHEHMKAAGYMDFERGERGSTAEHLSVLEYKTQQEAERAADLAAVVEEKEQTAAVLDRQAEKKQARLDSLDEKIAVSKKSAASIATVEGMARKTIGGNIQLSPSDWETASTLAKEGVGSRGIIKRLKDKIKELTAQIAELTRENARQKAQLARYGEGLGITDTMKYHQAKQRAPRRLTEIIADILRKPPEQERSAPERKKQQDIAL